MYGYLGITQHIRRWISCHGKRHNLVVVLRSTPCVCTYGLVQIATIPQTPDGAWQFKMVGGPSLEPLWRALCTQVKSRRSDPAAPGSPPPALRCSKSPQLGITKVVTSAMLSIRPASCRRHSKTRAESVRPVPPLACSFPTR